MSTVRCLPLLAGFSSGRLRHRNAGLIPAVRADAEIDDPPATPWSAGGNGGPPDDSGAPIEREPVVEQIGQTPEERRRSAQ
jgi:hypothetical protein